ncbi:aldehyde ferredoxin oxidoreductase N-terminal domain-containing protein [Chloroflexota bacterium]
MYGWMGKILNIDLSTSTISEFATQSYTEQYLGGRGIASRIYWETVAPETKAFDPDNRLIFMTGPLVATGAQGATRMAVVSKSPMTLPEGFCYGNIGGFVGAELKKAGFDGVVITGRASKPVYLWIHDGEAELRNASSLWGQNVYQVADMLKQVHGEKSRFITTGVAGENKVRTAVLVGSHFSAASAGFGAVMGSKNLKALVILGNKNPAVADPEGLKELNRYTIQISRGLNISSPPHVMLAGRSMERVGKGGCYQCGMDCLRGWYRYGGRLEAYRKCQAMDYYWPPKYGQENEPLETFFDAPTLANDYALDTWELQSIIDWLYDCHNTKILTEQDTGLPLSKIGTRDFLKKLLHAIAYREGFGDILAEGMVRIGDRVSAKARALFNRFVAPIGMNDWNPPRVFVVNALLYPLEPRIHHNMLHEVAFVNAGWNLNRLQPGSTPVTNRVVHDIARVFWGSEAAGNFSSYEGKALAAKMIQNRTYIKESLGLCDFSYPLTFSLTTPDNVGDPDLGAKLFTAVTGINGEGFNLYGDRINSLQRLILLREGRKVPEDDYPPHFNFTEPYEVSDHSDIAEMAVVPGPGDSTVSFVGNLLDRNKFTDMLQEHYRLRGCDEKTGLPKVETLKALGIGDLVNDKAAEF